MKPTHQLNEPCTYIDNDTVLLTVWNVLTSWMNPAQTWTVTPFHLQYETCSPAEWTLHRHGQWHHFTYSMKPAHQLNEPCTDMDSDTISLTVWNLLTSWMNLAQTWTVTPFHLQYETCLPAEWTLHRHRRWHHFTYSMKRAYWLNEPFINIDGDAVLLNETHMHIDSDTF